MSHAAEQAVLGSIMLDAAAYHRVAGLIDGRDFSAPEHRHLWELLSELIRDGSPIDAVTVGEIAERKGLAGKIGGSAYIVELADGTPGAASAEAHAGIVRGHAIRRRVRAVGKRLAEMDATGDDALAEAQRLIGLIQTRASAESVSIRDALKDVYRRMEERYSGVALPVTPTPWDGVNRMLGGGLGDGKLIIVAARPGMGKTAWMRGVAEAASDRGHSAIISMEMDREELAGMMLAGAAGISYQHVRDPRAMPDDDWSPIVAGMAALSERHISICDVPALSLPAIIGEARRLHSKRKLSALLIDYLGLMDLPQADRNDIAIGQITRGLKRLARDISAPVVLLCQLNRSVEQRADKRPMMSDLRDAGQIEQDADVIAFLYRDRYYNSESPYGDIAECNIAKQRGGRTGVVPLVFRGEQIAFGDYGGEWPLRIEQQGGRRGRDSGFGKRGSSDER